ncbi:MAG: DUF975 family protein [Alkalibacterium sp.]|nr:DUF975 family protein [Alkalibacterium sp.]
MTIGMLRGQASQAMKGNRLILMVGYVLSLVTWTLTAQIFINVFGFDRVFSIIDLFAGGWSGFQWTYLLMPVLLIILFLLGDMLHMSYRWFGLDLLNNKALDVKRVFQGFQKTQARKLFSLIALRGAIVLGWTLLFVIPGIWKAYLYSQAANCLKDDPTLNAMQALKKSEDLMKGNSYKYAILQGVFAPWYVVPIGLFVFFIWSNRAELQVGLETGQDGAELIFGVVLAFLLMIGLVLLLFSLYVEPYKMVSKQAFYQFIAHPAEEDPYDDFEKELMDRQGLKRNSTQVTPRIKK